MYTDKYWGFLISTFLNTEVEIMQRRLHEDMTSRETISTLRQIK